MPAPRKSILAGVAAVALAGLSGYAAAELKHTHALDVRLPDGSVAHVRYSGDTPPTLNVAAEPVALSMTSPAFDPLGSVSPFAALERISDAMDRQAAAMLGDVTAPVALGFVAPDLTPVDLGKLPPGVEGFSMVSTWSGKGACTRSVQYRSLGDGKPPQVVSRTAGDCAADQKRPAPLAPSGSAAEGAPRQAAGAQPV